MRVPLKGWLKLNGYNSIEEAVEELIEYDEGIAPALCTEECEVEPDGYCEHGAPSILLAAGMI